MKKFVFCTLAALGVFLGAMLCVGPVVINDDSLTCHYSAAIDTQARGLYSSRLWLVPAVVKVTNFTGDRVEYTIYYLPFGSVEMSYTQSDGYNIQKPLIGI